MIRSWMIRLLRTLIAARHFLIAIGFQGLGRVLITHSFSSGSSPDQRMTGLHVTAVTFLVRFETYHA